MTTTMRFDLKFFYELSKYKHPRMLHSKYFLPKKLALLPLSEQVKPSPNCKMIKLLTFLPL